jgi:hypothetical protein
LPFVWFLTFDIKASAFAISIANGSFLFRSRLVVRRIGVKCHEMKVIVF